MLRVHGRRKVCRHFFRMGNCFFYLRACVCLQIVIKNEDKRSKFEVDLLTCKRATLCILKREIKLFRIVGPFKSIPTWNESTFILWHLIPERAHLFKIWVFLFFRWNYFRLSTLPSPWIPRPKEAFLRSIRNFRSIAGMSSSHLSDGHSIGRMWLNGQGHHLKTRSAQQSSTRPMWPTHCHSSGLICWMTPDIPVIFQMHSVLLLPRNNIRR